MPAANSIVKITLNNKTRTSRILKVIASHADITIDGVTYAAFLGRRARFNRDATDTVSTYGADHAYLVNASEILTLKEGNTS